MKAIVLAGGYATRMWPITKDRPKMFLPVGEEVIIDDIFQDLEADDRVDEVFISTNEKFADHFAEYLDERPYEKPTISVEDTSGESEKFGVVGALAQLIDRENVDDDLLVVAGDNLISFDMGEFADFLAEKDAPVLAAYDVESRERAKSYGLVELDGDRVVNFQEKPEDPNSTLVSIACYGFPRETLPKFDEYLADDNNPDEPGWLMQWLQERQAVYAFTFDGAWFDIGTPESYLEAVAWALDGENTVHGTATVENSDLGENVHVMAGAEVTDSTLDQTILYENAVVRDATLHETIVDEEAVVDDVDLTDSLVGAYTELNGE